MTLSDFDFLRIWEHGQGQHPLDRLITILQANSPDRSRQELADLTIGQRDKQLLAFREVHFGRLLQAYGVCPACEERWEFALHTEHLRQGETQRPPQQEFILADGDFEVRYRLPTSRDLAASATREDLGAAQELILTQCLLAATHKGDSVSLDDLPPEFVSRLIEDMGQNDPQADASLAMQCPACHQTWEMIFDIGLFVWNDLVMKAKRLLWEVHILASAYGWSEAEILTLTPARRRAYLDLVLS